MSHDELAQSLAAHLRAPNRMVWTNIQLGPVGSPRPDVYTIQKSFVRPEPRAYEVKVSLSDFRGDVTAGKWREYLNYATGVYFASRRGLLTRDEIPAHTGLILYGESGWRVAKKPTLSPVDLPTVALLKLLIDGVEREGPRYRVKSWNESFWMKKASNRWGNRVAKAIAGAGALEADIEHAKAEAERILSAARRQAERMVGEEASLSGLRIELCGVLGLSTDSDEWQIRGEISRIKTDQRRHPALRQLDHITRMLGPLHKECATFCDEAEKAPEVGA